MVIFSVGEPAAIGASGGRLTAKSSGSLAVAR